MKNITINNTTITPCTAIPCIDGEYNPAYRQEALLISELLESGERVDTVVFGGYDAPATAEELAALWDSIEWYEAERDWETLETVEVA